MGLNPFPLGSSKPIGWLPYATLLICLAVQPEVESEDRKSPSLTDLTPYVLPMRVPVFTYRNGRKQHHTELCSGTLLATLPPTILTAWHCFDGLQDLTRPPKGFLGDKWIPLKLIASGDSMAADWALLTLDGLGDLVLPRGLAMTVGTPDVFSIAGFSDDRPGESTELSIDHGCTITGQLDGWLTTNCEASEGASGGPAVGWVEDELVIFGVISAKDEVQTLLITPVSSQIYPPGLLPSPP